MGESEAIMAIESLLLKELKQRKVEFMKNWFKTQRAYNGFNVKNGGTHVELEKALNDISLWPDLT